jgi:hypothetical protein
MAHEALDLDSIHAGVEEIGGEGAPPVVRAEVTDASLAGPAVNEGVDGLGCEAADGEVVRRSVGFAVGSSPERLT